ncbi:Phytanoyl-CoA dioxygenase [Haliangium ochraceum DSM 14365]|uniref:Phytanoyl-CoA dioxygenase n=2 Tax=Haliangium ochraceum TaxID=80816 RepID=D0LYP5_HALO1|nr:Phytanoyl-CoA dioxygenase [Haliangium ochraceum DSM 14365]
MKAALGVLGQGKSFRHNPILGHPTLNRYGLHVARVLGAELATRLRWWQLRSFATAEQRRAFHRDGFLVIENFLPAAEHQRIRDELRAYDGPARDMQQGDTITRRVLLDSNVLARLPGCRALVERPGFQHLLRYGAAQNQPPLLFIQQIRNGHAQPSARARVRVDPQKHLHADTFHPTMKAWYFLDSVAEDAGPFTYVPGSHRLTRARLRWEYAYSVTANQPGGNRYAANGSPRVSEDELPALGLPPPRRLAVAANTLVIANTHGFHARGPSAQPSKRLELWAYARPNPFVPWVYPLGLPTAGIEATAMRWWFGYQERRAAKRGQRPTWLEVERADFAAE